MIVGDASIIQKLYKHQMGIFRALRSEEELTFWVWSTTQNYILEFKTIWGLQDISTDPKDTSVQSMIQ